MKLTILYFARMREAVGRDRDEVEVPSEVDSVGALRRWLCAQGQPYAAAFRDIPRVRAALDQTMAGDDAPLRDGAEVAFFPPVTGG
jgi:molybdopterin synthase sulfur carrier subunit